MSPMPVPVRTRAGAPLVTISVVSHGDGVALRRLMDSIAQYERPANLQLIVTDNLGRDLPDLDPSGWHSLVMCRNERTRGYATNHNTAFGQASGEYFCILNPDVLFVESILGRLVALIESGDGDITAPLVVDSDGRVQDSFRRLPLPLEIVRRRIAGSALAEQIPDGRLIHPDWIAGLFLLMQRGTFARLGGFDSRYHLYFEDVDLCTRARLAGLSVAVSTVLRLQHDARRTSRLKGKYLFWHSQSAVRFFTSAVYRNARTALKSHG